MLMMYHQQRDAIYLAAVQLYHSHRRETTMDREQIPEERQQGQASPSKYKNQQKLVEFD